MKYIKEDLRFSRWQYFKSSNFAFLNDTLFLYAYKNICEELVNFLKFKFSLFFFSRKLCLKKEWKVHKPINSLLKYNIHQLEKSFEKNNFRI